MHKVFRALSRNQRTGTCATRVVSLSRRMRRVGGMRLRRSVRLVLRGRVRSLVRRL
jgi:hypothetical protein